MLWPIHPFPPPMVLAFWTNDTSKLLRMNPSARVVKKMLTPIVFIPFRDCPLMNKSNCPLYMNPAPDPTSTNCGIRKRTVMGRGDDDDDDGLDALTTDNLFDSVSAAAAMPSAARNKPIPIFCEFVRPRGLIRGPYNPKVISMGSTKKMATEPAGKLKAPTMDLFMVEACSTEKVISCENAVQKRIVVAQNGKSLAIILTSSTLVTEDTFQGSGTKELVDDTKASFVGIAALSKNLDTFKKTQFGEIGY
nr:hypothetical protein GW17_00007083 [Ipomoea batatas]